MTDSGYPLAVLETLKEWGSFSPGLDRSRSVLEAIGRPHMNYPHMVVGGTNGKGTVASNLAAALPGKTGLFVSPHVHDIRERITVDGAWLPDALWQEAHRYIEARAPNPDLSFFEWLTLLAVVMFDLVGVDNAVFEVGLGGRLDSVNILDPDTSILTNVSLDHTEILGDTVEQIAQEKIEIARQGRPFYLPASILAIEAVRQRLEVLGCDSRPLALYGVFEDNLTVVNRVLEDRDLAPRKQLLLPPARRLYLELGAGVYVDAAHNEAGWKGVADWIGASDKGRVNVLSALSLGRSPRCFLEVMKPVSKQVYVWDVPFEKALGVEHWPAEVEVVKTTDLKGLLEEPLLVCGSMYMVGLFLEWAGVRS